MKNLLKGLVIISTLGIIVTGCKEEEKTPPELGETNIVYVSEDEATISAELISEGDEYVSDEGVCYSTEPTPTIDDNTTEKNVLDEPDFVEIEDLSKETTYYVRGFATSDVGTSYGEEISFTTTSPVTDIDGNEYPTVQIGDQIWMAENLKTTTYNDGIAIPNVSGDDDWSNLSTPAFSWWQNDTDEANDDWGAYYNYYAVETGKLAPEGWHVATESEWNELIDFVGDDADKIKHTGSSNFSESNQTNFSAYMAGYRAGGSGGFARRSEWSFIWIGGENATGVNYSIRIESGSNGFEKDANSSETGSSVRCIKDSVQ